MGPDKVVLTLESKSILQGVLKLRQYIELSDREWTLTLPLSLSG